MAEGGQYVSWLLRVRCSRWIQLWIRLALHIVGMKAAKLTKDSDSEGDAGLGLCFDLLPEMKTGHDYEQDNEDDGGW